jgi:hypothetical protein
MNNRTGYFFKIIAFTAFSIKEKPVPAAKFLPALQLGNWQISNRYILIKMPRF